MSLRTRVAIAVGAVVFGALAVVAAVVYPAVGANLRGQEDESLVQVAQNAPTIAMKLKQARTPLGQLVPFGDTQLQIVPDAAVGPTNGFVGITDHDVQVADGHDQPYFHDEAYGSVVYRIYTTQFPGNRGVLVRVALPEAAAASTQTALGWLLVALVPAGAIGAAVVARLAAGQVLRPVGRLTETVERIRATGDLSAPIETPGRDEISRLGQAFAAMTAALDESVGAQRRLVADASHELRTPLTSLTTNLELLAERPDDPSAPALAAAALAEAGELRVLINDLVELARDGRASFHIEDVRLDLDAQFSPDGGLVEVSTTTGRDGTLTLTVRDHGPGIPEADLPYIFDRFYRSAQARALPGSGLGLAIVRRIADMHDGTVEAIPLQQGVKFRLSVPEIVVDQPTPERTPAGRP